MDMVLGLRNGKDQIVLEEVIMFTTKHYRAVAEVIKQTMIDTVHDEDLDDSEFESVLIGVAQVARNLSRLFKEDSSEFDLDKFRNAVGMPGL